MRYGDTTSRIQEGRMSEKNYDIRFEWYKDLVEKLEEKYDSAETDVEKILIDEIAEFIKGYVEIINLEE